MGKGAMRRGRLREGVMGRERQGWVNGEVWRVDMKERGREGVRQQRGGDGEGKQGEGLVWFVLFNDTWSQ